MIQIQRTELDQKVENAVMEAIIDYLSTPEGRAEAAKTILAFAGKSLIERSLGAQSDVIRLLKETLVKELLESEAMQEIKASILDELKTGGLDRVLMPLLLEQLTKSSITHRL